MYALPSCNCLRRLALTVLVLANLAAAALVAGGEAGQDKQLRPVVDGSGLFLASDGKHGDSPAAAATPAPPASIPATLVQAACSRPAQALRRSVLSSPHQPQAPPLLT